MISWVPWKVQNKDLIATTLVILNFAVFKFAIVFSWKKAGCTDASYLFIFLFKCSISCSCFLPIIRPRSQGLENPGNKVAHHGPWSPVMKANSDVKNTIFKYLHLAKNLCIELSSVLKIKNVIMLPVPILLADWVLAFRHCKLVF